MKSLMLVFILFISSSYRIGTCVENIEEADTIYFVDVLEERQSFHFSRVREESGYFIIGRDSTIFHSFWDWKAPVHIDTAWTTWRMRGLTWSARRRSYEIEMIDGNWPHSHLHYRF